MCLPIPLKMPHFVFFIFIIMEGNTQHENTSRSNIARLIPLFQHLMQYAATSRPVIKPSDNAQVHSGKTTYAFFCYGTCDSRSLHFTLGVDYNAGIILNRAVHSVKGASNWMGWNVPQSIRIHHLAGARLCVDERLLRAWLKRRLD